MTQARARAVVGAMSEADALKHGRGSRPALVGIDALRSEGQLDVGEYRQTQQHGLLEDHGQPGIGAGFPVPVDLSRIRWQQAGKEAQQHGLARTVGAEDDADALAGQLEVELVEHASPLRAEAQAGQTQGKHQPYLRAAQARNW
jgi:hypothetical protein